LKRASGSSVRRSGCLRRPCLIATRIAPPRPLRLEVRTCHGSHYMTMDSRRYVLFGTYLPAERCALRLRTGCGCARAVSVTLQEGERVGCR
jgi:hypothetical protein